MDDGIERGGRHSGLALAEESLGCVNRCLDVAAIPGGNESDGGPGH